MKTSYLSIPAKYLQNIQQIALKSCNIIGWQFLVFHPVARVYYRNEGSSLSSATLV